MTNARFSSLSLSSIKPLLQLIYPPLCLHCQDKTESLRALFCPRCLEYLTLIDISSKSSSSCSGEQWHQATCEPFGPALSLFKHSQRRSPACIKAIASLMVMRWVALDWTLPDIIVPLPTHLWPFFSKSRDVTLQIAQECVRMIGAPVLTLLKKQINWNYFKDPQEEHPSSLIRSGQGIADHKILLISLTMDPSTLKEASALLLEGFPSQIHSLSFLDFHNEV